jgi:hypothetical protein
VYGGEAVVREVDDVEVAEAVERRSVQLDDLRVDDADGLELAQPELTEGVRPQLYVPGILDLQVGDTRAEVLVVQQFAAPEGDLQGSLLPFTSARLLTLV